jgi:hypothetical protein
VISLLTRNPIRHSYVAVGETTIYPHMKLKNLTKKIRRLEARLLKDAKKLAKLKRKRGAASAAKTKSKSRGPAEKARKTATGSARAPGAAKVKRKLNLTPERRAQLAATMKARWAARRAAATNPQTNSGDPGSAQ